LADREAAPRVGSSGKPSMLAISSAIKRLLSAYLHDNGLGI
jgi:hypothetical protein